MADTATEETTETETEASGGGRTKLLLVGAALAVAGAAAYFLLFAPRADPSPAGAVEEPTPVEQVTEGEIVEIAPMTVNLAGTEMRYGRVGLGVVLDATAERAAVEARLAVIKDAAIARIMTYHPDTLRTAEGTDQLRAELGDDLVALFPDGEVVRIVITELIVQ